MVRYAEWREAVDPERKLERFDPVMQLAGSLAAGAGGVLCCGCISIPAFLLTWKAMGTNLLLRRVNRLRDLPSPHLQVACRLLLKQGSTTYGRDEGLLSFLDGAVVFEGRRTSFSFSGVDAPIEFLTKAGLSFRFPTPVGDCRAILHAVDRDEMAIALESWAVQPGSRRNIVFPPFRPSRSGWRKAKALERGAWTLGIGGFACGVQWAYQVDPLSGLYAIFASLLSAALLLGVAKKHLRRLNVLQQTSRSSEAG